MGRPQKSSIKTNASYLKDWDTFQKKHPSKWPILLPLTVSIEDGILSLIHI